MNAGIWINPPGGAQPVIPQPRLVEAAHEFEAQMMKELLRPVAQSMDADGESASGPMADFAAEALGQALSARGGLGIATSIIHRLSGDATGQAAGLDCGKGSKLIPERG